MRSGSAREDGTYLCPRAPRSALQAIRVAAGDGDAAAWTELDLLATEMERLGRGRDDPVREVFALLGDRWTMLILLALRAGDWHHAVLRRIVGALSIEGAISQRMLTLKLRALERNGFICRIVSDDVPPRVKYLLSERGSALLVHAQGLLDWVGDVHDAIEASRRAFADPP